MPALDGVRGLAIAGVLMVHLFVRNAHPEGSLPVRAVTAVLGSGWVGVDLFFVLSGFLITGILYDTRGTEHFFRNFYIRRALRIFPLYYAFIAIIYCISRLQGYHWGAAGVTAILLYVINLFPAFYTEAPWANLNHFWSLAMEEQFYMVWPTLVFLLAGKRRIAAAAFFGVLFSLGLRVYMWQTGMTAHDVYKPYAWTPAHLDGLFLGAILALLIRSRHSKAVLQWAPRLLAVLGLFWLTMLVKSGALHPIGDHFIATYGTTVIAFTFMCVVACVLRTGSIVAAFFSTRVLRALGKYSYGIYICHYTLHAALDERIWWWASARTQSKILPIMASGTIILAISVCIAVLSFHFFESPILRLKDRFAAHGGKPKLRREVEAANI